MCSRLMSAQSNEKSPRSNFISSDRSSLRDDALRYIYIYIESFSDAPWHYKTTSMPLNKESESEKFSLIYRD